VLAPDKVSRAWLKLDEAIASFDLRLTAGERAIELGAAPGGACQRLLEAGLEVVGVDAALVDPVVAAHPRFTQWRMRARDVPLRRFHGCDWLLTDMNIDPRSTMDALGRVVTAPGVRLRGIIATLKLPDWSRAAEVPGWLEKFRSWGYEPAARQLSTGGREVCVVALPVGRRGRTTPHST
jgi:23S rRNA (cytidine2498-2'-O)-methyltransferase